MYCFCPIAPVLEFGDMRARAQKGLQRFFKYRLRLDQLDFDVANSRNLAKGVDQSTEISVRF